ncbi:hypothetical protein [Streptomyces sp. ISL-11]|uniref:hypothetical protein n=1 Tax=Streptomyces sp. ISL-11 TaxID=2819174 RepID=UPI001BEBD23E|nr:hypothetical protein [Streptomyces sp. ISL-11]MBT2386608.1 hypothetical protein [Streptomyces sp. ISL-11]
MISFKPSNKMTDRPVVAMRSLGFPFGSSPLSSQVTGLSSTGTSLGNERPTKAFAVTAAAKALAPAYALETTANGAGSLDAQQQHHTMWAFRGLEPWRDPA